MARIYLWGYTLPGHGGHQHGAFVFPWRVLTKTNILPCFKVCCCVVPLWSCLFKQWGVGKGVVKGVLRGYKGCLCSPFTPTVKQPSKVVFCIHKENKVCMKNWFYWSCLFLRIFPSKEGYTGYQHEITDKVRKIGPWTDFMKM